MDNEKRIKSLKEKDYQKYFGVTRATFDKMLEILEDADRYKRRKGGRPSVLSVLDKLVIMLQYYREYRIMDNIAFYLRQLFPLFHVRFDVMYRR